MDLIQSKSCLLGDTALAQYGGSTAFLTRSNHCYSTLIRLSAWLCSNLTRTVSTDSPYSLNRLASTSSRHLISISLDVLVRTLAFPREGVCYPFMHTHRVSVKMQYSCTFTPFNRTGKTRSTLVISQSSQVTSRSFNHSIIGISVTTPLNLGIS